MKTYKTFYYDLNTVDAGDFAFTLRDDFGVLENFSDTPGDDGSLDGTPGDDRFVGGAGGDDRINGGDGIDALSYSGITNATKVKVNMKKGKVKVKEKNDGQRGVDRIENIELIVGHDGRDIMKGGDGDDTFRTLEGNDKLIGGKGNDILSGAEGDDKVFGNRGADRFLLEAGRDIYKAGKKNGKKDGDLDTFHIVESRLSTLGQQIIKQFEADLDVLDFSDATFSFSNSTPFISDGANIVLSDNTTASSLADLIDAGFIRQEGKRKVVLSFGDSSSGEIILKGVKLNKLSDANFKFNDKAVFGRGGIPGVADNSGDDVYDGRDDLRDFDIDGGNGNDILNGNGGDDAMSGGEGDDILNGGAGDDVLFGGQGSDILRGGQGADGYFGDAGDDVLIIEADEDSDTVKGGFGADVMIFDFDHQEGEDQIFFDKAEDIMLFSSPAAVVADNNELNQAILSVNGNEVGRMFGLTAEEFDAERGKTILQIAEDHELFLGTPGNDDDGVGGARVGAAVKENVMIGMGGDDHLQGAELQDVLIGGAGNDTLIGAGGDDKLFGGEGSDVLNGGAGNDVMFAGKNIFGNDDAEDIFIFDLEGGIANFGDDTIHEYGFEDRFDLRALGITEDTFDVQVTIAEVVIDADRTDTLITVNDEFGSELGTITVIDATFINQNDFILAL